MILNAPNYLLFKAARLRFRLDHVEIKGNFFRSFVTFWWLMVMNTLLLKKILLRKTGSNQLCCRYAKKQKLEIKCVQKRRKFENLLVLPRYPENHALPRNIIPNNSLMDFYVPSRKLEGPVSLNNTSSIYCHQKRVAFLLTLSVFTSRMSLNININQGFLNNGETNHKGEVSTNVKFP